MKTEGHRLHSETCTRVLFFSLCLIMGKADATDNHPGSSGEDSLSPFEKIEQIKSKTDALKSRDLFSRFEERINEETDPERKEQLIFFTELLLGVKVERVSFRGAEQIKVGSEKDRAPHYEDKTLMLGAGLTKAFGFRVHLKGDINDADRHGLNIAGIRYSHNWMEPTTPVFTPSAKLWIPKNKVQFNRITSEAPCFYGDARYLGFTSDMLRVSDDTPFNVFACALPYNELSSSAGYPYAEFVSDVTNAMRDMRQFLCSKNRAFKNKISQEECIENLSSSLFIMNLVK